MSSSAKVLHILATVFLGLGFLVEGGGTLLLGSDSGEGGANIGLGILLLFGLLLGSIGVLFGLATLVLGALGKNRARS